jgi:hypothetical protein
LIRAAQSVGNINEMFRSKGQIQGNEFLRTAHSTVSINKTNRAAGRVYEERLSDDVVCEKCLRWFKIGRSFHAHKKANIKRKRCE